MGTSYIEFCYIYENFTNFKIEKATVVIRITLIFFSLYLQENSNEMFLELDSSWLISTLWYFSFLDNFLYL